MRTIVHLTPEQLEGLDKFRRRKNISRAAALREAVDRLLDEDRSQHWRSAFGA